MSAPIIIFAFNRVDSLKILMSSLKNCPESKYSDLSIFVDGPRNENDNLSIQEIKTLIESIEGFNSIEYHFSDTNKGLGPSIIAGVSEIINKSGQAIVLEDDLIVLPNFLTYINAALSKYKSDDKVFSICGYTNKVTTPKEYAYDSYFCTRSSSWGWATWADRWNSVDWSLEPWEKFSKYKKDFNRWGGSDCFGMLNGWKRGKNKSWAIRFCFSQFLQDRLSLFPVKSLVINDGFDGNGTNCKKWSRFKCELMDFNKTQFLFPESVMMIKTFYNQAMSYNSILMRIWSRIMYQIHK